MSEYFIYTTSRKHTSATAKRIQEAVTAIDPEMDWTGPVSIPGNHLTGWLSRPNDGNNNNFYQRPKNDKAAKAVEKILESTRRPESR